MASTARPQTSLVKRGLDKVRCACMLVCFEVDSTLQENSCFKIRFRCYCEDLKEDTNFLEYCHKKDLKEGIHFFFFTLANIRSEGGEFCFF